MLYSVPMSSLLSRLRRRLEHGLAMQEVLDRLAGRGCTFYPYIVFAEAVDIEKDELRLTQACEIRELTEDDIAGIASIPERPRGEAVLRERFRRGHVGIGAFDGGAIVAYTWCDLERFTAFGRGSVLRLLEPDEAYLYDAYTRPDYRGRSLVPMLRSEVYRVMRARGKQRLYSVSLYFNRSARRFKAKLNARELELRLWINLFDKFTRDFRLKRFPGRSAVASSSN